MLVEKFEVQILDQRLSIDKIENFRSVAGAYKIIDNLLKIANIFDFHLNKNFFNDRKP